MNRTSVLAVSLTLIMLGAPISGVPIIDVDSPVEPVSAAEQPSGENIIETDSPLDLWDRAVLPLRPTQSANGATEVRNLNLQLQGPDTPDGPANRNEIILYETDGELTLEFDESVAGVDTSQFEDDETQLLVGQLKDNPDGELSDLPTSGEDFFSELTEDDLTNLNNNVTFSAPQSGQTIGDESIEYEIDASGSGIYFAVLAVPHDEHDVFEVSDGDLETPNDGTVIGVDQFATQNDNSAVDAPESAEPGDEIEFDVDATEFDPSTETTHAVVVYDEDTFIGSGMTIRADEEFDGDFSADDFTIEHDIGELNGVQNVADDLSLLGLTLDQRTETGITQVADIIDFLASEADADDPNTEPGETVIDSSMTVIDGVGPDETVTVETLDDWDETEYQWVHIAVGESTSQIQSQEGSLNIEAIETDSDFQVEIDSVPESVDAGEQIDVSATVENVGDESDAQNIAFLTDDTQQDSTDVALDPDESQQVEFSFETDETNVPEVLVAVESDDDSDATVVSVNPAEFDLGDIEPDLGETVFTAGESGEIDVSVDNLGGAGTADVQLAFEDQTFSEPGVSFDAGESTTVPVSFTPAERPKAGVHTVRGVVTVTNAETEATERQRVTLQIDYGSIQSGVDLAESGEEVLVAPGTYDESVDVVPEVAVRGIGDRGAVTVSGGEDFPAFTLQDDSQVSNLEVADSQVGVQVDGDNTGIRSNQFELDSLETGVEVVGDSENTLIRGNVFSPGDEPTDGVIDLENEGGNSVVEFNTIVSSSDTGANTGTAISIEPDSSGTSEVAQNNLHANPEDSLRTVGANEFDIVVDGDSDLLADGNYDPTGALSIGSSVNEQNTVEDPLEPAEFLVDDIDTAEEIVEGEQLDIDATIVNDGEQGEQKTITLEVDGEEIDSQALDLDPGESDNVAFEYDTTDDAGETITLGVSTEDDDDERTVSVLREAAFDVSDLDTRDEVFTDFEFTTTATITNIGDVTASQSVELRVDGTTVDSESVELDGSSSQVVEFDHTETTAGVKTIGVFSDDDSETSSLTVSEPDDVTYAVSIDRDTSDQVVTEGDTATVEATIENIGTTDGDPQTIAFSIDGTEIDTDEVELDAGADTTVSFEYPTSSSDRGVRTAAVASDEDTETLSITVEEEEERRTGGGGGGGGATPPADDDDDVDDDVVDDEPPETPTVQEVRDELDQTEPSTQSTTPIVDNAPDRPGVTVNPEETESVREITFSSDDASGNVEITEWQDPPESVSESVSGSVESEVEADAASEIEASVSVPTVADITPDSDEVREDSGTVQMTIEEDRVGEPEDVTIAHERGDSWELLETTVVETENGEVTLEAETESFSLFAVTEIQTEEIEDEPVDAVEEPDEGLGTTGLIGLIVVLVLVVAAAVAYRQMNSENNNEL